MATERLISAGARPEEERTNWALRPTVLSEYVGQPDLAAKLSIALDAVRARRDAAGARGAASDVEGGGKAGQGVHLEHVLLHGPPGLGKTTLAHVIGEELGARVHVTSGPTLGKGTDLVAALTSLAEGDVLFIDEIHRLPVQVEEFIYPAMEDFRVDVCLDSGIHARTMQIRVKPFTLIGATTRAGLLSSPLRSRFGIAYHLRYYEVADLLMILERSCRLLGIERADRGALGEVARRCRGTPRIANRLLRRVRDYADVRGAGVLDGPTVEAALALEGIDEVGLDELDRGYLRTLATVYKGGPAGLEAIAATMNEDAGTLEDVVEPYLLQIGFLARTRRGRSITGAGAEHLGVRVERSEEERLF
jgi:Holliday junction DNA helicase RuvB